MPYGYDTLLYLGRWVMVYVMHNPGNPRPSELGEDLAAGAKIAGDHLAGRRR
jgi:hypothetical protein